MLNAKSPLAASIGSFVWKIKSQRGYQSELNYHWESPKPSCPMVK